MKIKLDQLESRLQALLEVRLVSILPGHKTEGLIAQQLAGALQSNITAREDGTKLAPNVYTIITHPDLAEDWQTDSRLLDGLQEILNTAASEADLVFAVTPTITTATDPALDPEEVHIIASHRIDTVSETQGMPVDEAAEDDGTDNLPENAFLIVHGTKVYPLTQSVVNIGRRMDNQLVIDDPRVSRSHAQLRAIKGRYILFDLNSTGGTFVNGQRTNQSILYPGDVISLSGVPLIFGQDNPPARPDLADTSPLSPASGDRPTAILKLEDKKE